MSSDIGEIILAQVDDWCTVYFNGEKVIENETIDPRDLLEALGISFNEIWVKQDYYDNNDGTLPEKWSEIPLNVLDD